MRRLLCAMLLLVASSSAATSIVVGDLRVTALSPKLVRIEPKGPMGFEDRTTFTIAGNRSKFSGIDITKANTTAAGVWLATAAYDVLIPSTTPPPTPARTCSDGAKQNTDVSAPQYSQQFGNGARAADRAACCALCESDSTCIAYVFAGSNGSKDIGNGLRLASNDSTKGGLRNRFYPGLGAITVGHYRGTLVEMGVTVNGDVLVNNAATLDFHIDVPSAQISVTCAKEPYTLHGQTITLDNFDKPNDCVASSLKKQSKAAGVSIKLKQIVYNAPEKGINVHIEVELVVPAVLQLRLGAPAPTPAPPPNCWPLMGFSSQVSASNREFACSSRQCRSGPELTAVKITNKAGHVLYDSKLDSNANPSYLHWPSPSDVTKKAYALMDYPRFYVPEWGAMPMPTGSKVDPALKSHNGYDFRNQVAGDTYIFLFGAASDSSLNSKPVATGAANAEQTPQSLAGWYESRAEFIALTGPCPVLPDFAFGTWFTSWHSYTEAEAKSDIGRWEKDELPIDVWVSGLRRQRRI